MKRTLFLTWALASCFCAVEAATYTDLTKSWCDETNNVIYDGQGYFAVESAANTSIDLTINLASLVSYVNSNDYKTGGYMLLWDDNSADYGLADNADTSVDNGSRTPYLSGYWNGSAWNADTKNISYETLSRYAVDGSVTLKITNVSEKNSTGVTVKVAGADGNDVQLYQATELLTENNTVTNGYYVNLNYITSVTLHTDSTLDTDSYVPPKDYSKPFESQRTDGTSIGRVTFLGDSITHGVDDQSYRWQLFKTLTDNGIENEIVGPREGYSSMNADGIGETRDAGTSYGGTVFANVHLAQASGRTRNIISGKTVTTDYAPSQGGVNYGGHSTATTADAYDSNTWFCMMGTNDLLSDNGTSTDIYCQKMEEMLGGEVSYTGGSYNWRAGDNWGNMATIVNDVHGEGDTFYMLSILPWGAHNNNQGAENRLAAQEFNRNLKLWTETYSAKTGKKLVYVDVTRGMVDVTSSQAFRGHDSFFNRPGVAGTTTVQGLSNDGLHPGEQGSLIMAGNLAQAMGIGGRTAGLERASAAGWESAVVGELAAGTVVLHGENSFTMEGGYTVDFSAVFGNGATDGWLAAENALSISIGDGTNSGTLKLSEGYIMWGSDVLFCQDNSATGLDALRVVWHNGNEADNVLKGYYVWLGDMLIGQSLSATSGEGLNGILLSATGATGSLTGLSWTDAAYAPTTLGMVSVENAYITRQDAAAVSGFVAHGGGVDFTNATETAATAGQFLVTNSTASDDRLYNLTSGAGWTGLTNCGHSGDISVRVTGATTNTVFGSMNGADAGHLLVQVVEGATVGDGTYDYVTAAIAGSYNGGSAEQFSVCINGGTVSGDIVGGSINGTGKIGSAVISVNGGTVKGQIVAGSKITEADAAVGQAVVTVTGGTIEKGITKGNAEYASVSIVGNAANIGGDIEADKVTLRNVSADRTEGGFDAYSGTIKASVVVLDNVQNNIQATLEELKSIAAINRTNAELTAGETLALDSMELDGDTSLGLFKSADDHTVSTATETTLTISGVLTVSGSGATLNANLVMGAGSELKLAGNSLQLGSSLTLGGVQLDDITIDKVTALDAGVALTLFTEVDELILDGVSYTEATDAAASTAFANTELAEGYRLVYSGADAGGAVSIMAVPEPATTTLSLLALAALAARRRRK